MNERIDIASTLEEAVEPRDRAPAPGAEEAPLPGASAEPAPMRCRQCGTTWYSRVAALIIDAGMSCARCGAPLTTPTRIG